MTYEPPGTALVKVYAPRDKRRTLHGKITDEQKARIVTLLCRALIHGWSVRKFSRYVRISHVTILYWVNNNDLYFDQYTRAMQTKAIQLPQVCDDVMQALVGKHIDAKTASVMLRHLEFRMMREIKHAAYAAPAARRIDETKSLAEMDDDELDRRYQALLSKATGNSE